MLLAASLVVGGCAEARPRASDDAVHSVRVRVSDALSGAALPHARVTLDEQVVETGSDGVATAPASVAPTRVRVEAPGFVPALWVGFAQKTLVVRLRPVAPPPSPEGSLFASVRDTHELPPLAPGHVRTVHVRATLPAAHVTAYAGPLSDIAKADTCEIDPTGRRPCEVELRGPPGRQRVYGWVVDSVPGAFDPGDSRLVGLLLSRPTEVTTKGEPARVDLYPMAKRSLVSVAPRLAAVQGEPSAAPVGVPGVKLDDGTGVMLLPSVGGKVWLPRRRGALHGAGYWMLAEADTREQGDDVRLRMVARRLAEDGFVLDRWSPAPARPRLSADRRTLRLEGGAARGFHALGVTDARGALVADVVLWNSQREARLPDAWSSRIARVTLWSIENAGLPDAEELDVAALQASADAVLSRTTTLP